MFLPSFAGEVSPSYGDGGVMGLRMVHDPSVRCADTSPSFAWGGSYAARTNRNSTLSWL
jgi:hypothetical protein